MTLKKGSGSISGRVLSPDSNILEVVRGRKSVCCGWPVMTVKSDFGSEGKEWYECSHCRKPCNVVPDKRPVPGLARALQAHAVDPRVARLPKWAQNLIAGLITERNELLK